MDRPFLGRGWGFPTRLDADGRVVPVAGEAAVEQSIKLILQTALGERIMRPDFGCGLHAHLFAPGNVETVARMIGDIRSAITRWEPRVDLADIAVRGDDTDPSLRIVEVTAVVRSTNSRVNVVYPFYLDGGAEVADV
ncbi:MAG: GPW/gp25 family protein [Myxococcales bacterium]|nr:GPW/gp25 family protein [Myxococcales bacterium]